LSQGVSTLTRLPPPNVTSETRSEGVCVAAWAVNLFTESTNASQREPGCGGTSADGAMVVMDLPVSGKAMDLEMSIHRTISMGLKEVVERGDVLKLLTPNKGAKNKPNPSVFKFGRSTRTAYESLLLSLTNAVKAPRVEMSDASCASEWMDDIQATSTSKAAKNSMITNDTAVNTIMEPCRG